MIEYLNIKKSKKNLNIFLLPISLITSIILILFFNFITFIFMKYFGKLIKYSFAFELLEEIKNEKNYLKNVNRLLKIIKKN